MQKSIRENTKKSKDKIGTAPIFFLWVCGVIQRASNIKDILPGDVGINHGCLKILMSEEFLDRSNVITLLQKVGGKAVSERMDGGLFGDIGLDEGRFEGLLQGRWMNMVSSYGEGSRIHG